MKHTGDKGSMLDGPKFWKKISIAQNLKRTYQHSKKNFTSPIELHEFGSRVTSAVIKL